MSIGLFRGQPESSLTLRCYGRNAGKVVPGLPFGEINEHAKLLHAKGSKVIGNVWYCPACEPERSWRGPGC